MSEEGIPRKKIGFEVKEGRAGYEKEKKRQRSEGCDVNEEREFVTLVSNRP